MFKGLNKKNAQAIIVWALWNNIGMITRAVALRPWSCESVDFGNSGPCREPACFPDLIGLWFELDCDAHAGSDAIGEVIQRNGRLIDHITTKSISN